MKNIKLMSFNELCREFGLSLKLYDINQVITDEEIAKDFFEELKVFRKQNIGKEKEFIAYLLSKYSSYIDPEAYVFFTLKTRLNDLAAMADKRHSKKVENCKEALKNSKFYTYIIDFSSTEPGTEIKKLTARKLVTGEEEKERKGKNAKKLEMIEEDIDLMDLFSVDSPEQMVKFFGRNKRLNEYVFKLGMIQLIRTEAEISHSKMLTLIGSNDYELGKLFEEYQEKLMKHSNDSVVFESIPIYLRKFPEEFDIDIILMIAAYRANYFLENAKLNDEDSKKYIRVLQVAAKYLKNSDLEISNLPSEEYYVPGNSDFTYDTIVEACSRISSEGEYLNKKETAVMRKAALEQSNAITEMNPELVRIIGFSIEEYRQIASASEGNLTYLVNNNLLSDQYLDRILDTISVKTSDFITLIQKEKVSSEQIEKYLRRQETIDEELFSEMDQKGLLSSSKKLDYYISGKIDINLLTAMDDERRTEFSKELSPQKLVELYQDEQRKDEYARYVNAFRTFILAGKTKEEKRKIEDSILNELDLNMEDEDLVRLYQEHLISLETVESWGGSALITSMMRNAILKPIDVKEICNNNYDSLFDIMKDRTIPRKNKLAIFYTTFADEDDTLTKEQQESREKAKIECLKYMRFSDKVARVKGTQTTTSRQMRTSESVDKRNEYVLDPINRWTLLKLLDSDYSYEILEQGMMIFHLPNINGGTVILEKMFRKEQPDYGRATKIIRMPLEDFEKIKSDLIISGDIPVMALEIHPALKGKIDSYWHSPSWGQKIADSLGYKVDQQRTAENIDKIDKEILKIKKSRRLRD